MPPDHSYHRAASPLFDLPSFALSCSFDDADDPRRVTVFDDDADAVRTNWISVDVAHAVDLAEVA